MATQSDMVKDQEAAREAEWEELKRRSGEYPPSVKFNSRTADKRPEFESVGARLQQLRVDVAVIGSKGTYARARVVRAGQPERELFDSGECRKDTAANRLSRFLSQQIVLEATRCAGQ